jgi:hypothetical protein
MNAGVGCYTPPGELGSIAVSLSRAQSVARRRRSCPLPRPADHPDDVIRARGSGDKWRWTQAVSRAILPSFACGCQIDVEHGWGSSQGAMSFKEVVARIL